jgi:hypothetical protein
MATDMVLANITEPGIGNVNDTTKRAAAHKFLAWQDPVTVMRTLSRLLLVWFLVMGCAPVPPLPFTLPSGSGQASVLTLTQVNLAQRNYRVVRTNVVGTSRGFALLGLITVKPPDATEAFARLYEAGGMVRPSAWAVFRLMTSSNWVGWCIGSSPGFAPLSGLRICTGKTRLEDLTGDREPG